MEHYQLYLTPNQRIYESKNHCNTDILLCFLSCSKDKGKDYTEEYIGVYTAQNTNGGGTFSMLIDKKENDTILITTKWLSSNQTVKAVIDKYEFTIPYQFSNPNAPITGNGSLLNGKTIAVNYYYSGQTMRIIATK